MSITSFIPTIWSARLLEHLDTAHVAKSFFNTNWEGEIQNMGNTVRINQIGDVEIVNYVANTDLPAPEELETLPQDLVIDQGDAFNFQIDDIDAVQKRADLMDAAMQRAGFKLADKKDRFLFKTLADAAGNKLTSINIATPEQAFELLVEMRTMLAKTDTPTQDRNIGVPPEMAAMLLKDPRFTGTGGAFAEGTLLSGLIGRAMGFRVYEVNNLPRVGGMVKIIANHNVSATEAGQIVKTEAYRMEKRFADGLKGLNTYGAKVVIPEAVAVAEVTFAGE